MLGRGEGGGRGSSKKGAVRLKRNYYFLFVHQVVFLSVGCGHVRVLCQLALDFWKQGDDVGLDVAMKLTKRNDSSCTRGCPEFA